jgi:hypothetical protein
MSVVECMNLSWIIALAVISTGSGRQSGGCARAANLNSALNYFGQPRCACKRDPAGVFPGGATQGTQARECPPQGICVAVCVVTVPPLSSARDLCERLEQVGVKVEVVQKG